MTSVFLAVQLFTGLAIYAYFAGCDPVLNGSIKRYDQILPYIVMILFDGVLLVRGIFLSVIFAAALRWVNKTLMIKILNDFIWYLELVIGVEN